MKYPISVALSMAQYRLFQTDIKAGIKLGDCRLSDGGPSNLCLMMDDYEGANAMVGRFGRRERETRRQFLTWHSVVGRLHAAIATAARGHA